MERTPSWPNPIYLKTKNLVLRTRSNILAMLSFPIDPIGNPESKLTLDSRKACPRENGDAFGNDILVLSGMTFWEVVNETMCL